MALPREEMQPTYNIYFFFCETEEQGAWVNNRTTWPFYESFCFKNLRGIFCKVVNTVSTSPKSINKVLTYLDNLVFLLFYEVLLSPILSADI